MGYASTPQHGPKMYQGSLTWLDTADGEALGSPGEEASLRYAHVHAVNAQTAALVMIAGILADATNNPCFELESWADVIPAPPLKECKRPTRTLRITFEEID